jgi:hypothetical protein
LIRDGAFETHEWRRAWHELLTFYAMDNGGSAGTSAIKNAYDRSIWTGGSIMTHIQNMKVIAAELASIGREISPDDQLHAIRNSIRWSNNRSFDTTINLSEELNWSLEGFIQRIQTKSTQLDLAHLQPNPNHARQVIEVSAAESESAHAANTGGKKGGHGGGGKGGRGPGAFAGVKCPKCGKKGHGAADCWQDITCGKCGKKGHPDWKCRADQDHSAAAASSSSSSSSSAHEEGGSRKTKTVNLTDAFRNRKSNKLE